MCRFRGCGEWILPVQGTGWGPPSQEGGALHFALGRRTPQSSLRTPCWCQAQGKGGPGPPGPKSRGSSEGRSVLHESWAPRSWGPTRKRLLHRTVAPAARWPGPAMRGPTRPPGGSARGGASAEPEPARRERPESAGRPPRLPACGPGRGCPTASSQVAADPAGSRLTLCQGASFDCRPDWAHQPPNEPVCGSCICHRLPVPGLSPSVLTGSGPGSVPVDTFQRPVGNTHKVGSMSAQLQRLGEGSLRTGDVGPAPCPGRGTSRGTKRVH